MRTQTFSAEDIEQALHKAKVATMEELVAAAGNPTVRTVFRKLEEIEYLRSYSHRGKYYTLQALAQFDADGLWEFRSVRFSRLGSLIDTAEAFVERSSAGFTPGELEASLHVESSHALLQCLRENRLSREAQGRGFLYLSADPKKARRQRNARRRTEAQEAAGLIVQNPRLAVEEAKAALLLFFSLLDEPQRRRYAGLESLRIGHGGDQHIGSLLGMDPHTVAKGRRELLHAEVGTSGQRKPGGGRHSAKKKPTNH